MNFIVTRRSRCAKVLLLMASLCVFLNCHKPQPKPQLGPSDAGVANKNSNSNQNAEETAAKAPDEPETKSSPRPSRRRAPAAPHATPEAFASREDDAKTIVAERPENANTELSPSRRALRARRAAPARRP